VASGSSGQPRWRRMAEWIGRPFLTRQEKARITAVVAEEERLTTARIHVYVKAHTAGTDFLAYARRRFVMLGLDRTPERNDVLILISHLDRRFAIWGGEELHARTGKDLWELARNVLAVHLAEGRNAEGIEACVRTVGQELARHFPRAGSSR
jgi:uncharacterized membrane protein